MVPSRSIFQRKSKASRVVSAERVVAEGEDDEGGWLVFEVGWEGEGCWF